jgi:phosphatidylglycerophosphatase A
MIKFVARWISSGFGSGYALRAPGTFGSVAAFIFWWLLHRLEVLKSPYATLILAVATTIVGTAAAAYCMRLTPNSSDPQWIVIDEWAGLFIALTAIPPAHWSAALLALVLFRIFDATKLGPVAWAEQLPGAYGVMADDVVAGALTAGVIVLCRTTGIL